jgi:tetratricopeptide (TPR) repeat protein
MLRSLGALLLTLPVLGACASSSSGRAPAPAPPRASASAPDASVEKGIAFYQQGRYQEAAAALATSSEVQGLAYLAASRVRLGQYAGAESAALQALQSSPADAVASAALGEALVSEGKLDEAIQRLTAVLQADPRLPYAHYWRGQAYQRQKQVARMVDDYEAFLRLAPDAPEAPALRAVVQSVQ